MAYSNLCLNDPKMKQSAGQYIVGKMHGVCTQKRLADKIGISQPALSEKLKKSRFEMNDIQVIVKELNLADDEIVMLVRRGKFE